MQDFCLTPWPATMYRWKAGEYPNADQQRMETQCFKSAWFNVALHEGFGFPQVCRESIGICERVFLIFRHLMGRLVTELWKNAYSQLPQSTKSHVCIHPPRTTRTSPPPPRPWTGRSCTGPSAPCSTGPGFSRSGRRRQWLSTFSIACRENRLLMVLSPLFIFYLLIVKRKGFRVLHNPYCIFFHLAY